MASLIKLASLLQMARLRYFFTFNLALILYPTIQAADTHDLSPLDKALKKQATFQSVTVKIRQTKKIPALTEPVKNTGFLWLQPGKAFRWQLGEPKAQTAIYDGSQVNLLDERKKTVTSYPPDHRKVKPLLLMLGMGDGASVAKMTSIFKVSGTTRHKEHYVIVFIPKSGKLKRAISSLILQINLKTSFMERIEWTQKDGTTVVTEFYPPSINTPLPKDIFTYKKSNYKKS